MRFKSAISGYADRVAGFAREHPAAGKKGVRTINQVLVLARRAEPIDRGKLDDDAGREDATPEFVKTVVADHAVFQHHALAAAEAMLDVIFVKPDDLDANRRQRSEFLDNDLRTEVRVPALTRAARQAKNSRHVSPPDIDTIWPPQGAARHEC
jgi:hypothetical protein